MATDPFQLVGSTVGGHYAVEAVVADTDAFVLYRARHTLWNRTVTLKAFRVPDTLDHDARAPILRALVREGALLAELSERTTGIAQARDIATLVTPSGEWVPFLVLEWIDGESLASVLAREGWAGLAPRSLSKAVALLEPIAEALTLAHDRGITYGELDTENIFVLAEPRGPRCTTKLLDFGLRWSPVASGPLSSDGRVRPLAPGSGAPEQRSDACGATGPWTDVFGLAWVLAQIVTGGNATARSRARLPSAIAASHRTRTMLRSVGLTSSEQEVLLRALAASPSERWQTVGSFWRALRDTLTREAPTRDALTRDALTRDALTRDALTRDALTPHALIRRGSTDPAMVEAFAGGASLSSGLSGAAFVTADMRVAQGGTEASPPPRRFGSRGRAGTGRVDRIWHRVFGMRAGAGLPLS